MLYLVSINQPKIQTGSGLFEDLDILINQLVVRSNSELSRVKRDVSTLLSSMEVEFDSVDIVEVKEPQHIEGHYIYPL